MNTPYWLKVLLHGAVLLALTMGISSCAQQGESLPNVWIDSPPDGAPLPSGGTVTVISHAYARQGVARGGLVNQWCRLSARCAHITWRGICSNQSGLDANRRRDVCRASAGI